MQKGYSYYKTCDFAIVEYMFYNIFFFETSYKEITKFTSF